MYDPMVTFIHHKKLCMVSQSYTEKVCLSRESKCQKYFSSEKLLKYYDIFKKSWVKRGLNLIMHIMVMKYGGKTEKIWINGSDKMEISKSDIFFSHPLISESSINLSSLWIRRAKHTSG